MTRWSIPSWQHYPPSSACMKYLGMRDQKQSEWSEQVCWNPMSSQWTGIQSYIGCGSALEGTRKSNMALCTIAWRCHGVLWSIHWCQSIPVPCPGSSWPSPSLPLIWMADRNRELHNKPEESCLDLHCAWLEVCLGGHLWFLRWPSQAGEIVRWVRACGI